MELGPYSVEAWLEQGPAHHLFRADDGLLVYEFLPTVGTAEREDALPYARELVNALGTPDVRTPPLVSSELNPERMLMAFEDRRVRRLAALEQPLAAPRALSLAHALLTALEPLHANGLHHGALTPSRVAIDEDGRLRVFGAGCALLAQEAFAQPLTTLTPRFAALYPEVSLVPPEVFQQRPLDQANDVFLVAANAFVWLAGRSAHGGGRALDVFARLRAGERERFAALESGVDAKTAEALDAALEPDPEGRPSRAELAEQLAPFASELDDHPGPAERWSLALPDMAPEEAPGPPGSQADERRHAALKVATAQLSVMRAHRPERQQRSPIASLVMIMVLVAAVVLFFFYFRPQLVPEPTVRRPGPTRTSPPRETNGDVARALPDVGPHGQSGTD